MTAFIVGILTAAVFWFILFGARAVNFWWGMTLASGMLAIWSIYWAKKEHRSLLEFQINHIVWGILSAAVLYVVFWAGDFLSTRILSFVSGEIDAIYGNKAQLDPRLTGILLFFWIGPAEEIFWRGMVQRVLSEHFNPNIGWLLGAAIYGAVHLWASNFTLFVAALIAGLFWGWIYKRFGTLWPGIISHSLWDVVVFLLLPL